MKIFIEKLEEGIHEYSEKIKAATYEFLDNECYPQPLQLNIYVDKINNLFRFKVNITTKEISICDRCLNRFNNDLDITIEQLYQIGSSDFAEEDDIEILPENTKEIDITKAINDAFIMNRPIQLVCNEKCKGLCPSCGINLNDKECKCQISTVDPRLEKLKSYMK